MVDALIDLARIGVFHGDIKEDNIVLSPRNNKGGPAKGYNTSDFHHCAVKLVDFGGAQLCDGVSGDPCF